MEEVSSEGKLAAGYMRVPWPSWQHWDFVRDSLFSSSPDSVAAALDRISAWRSRGCLPMAIQVTAAIVEIQQKDPFFSKGRIGEEVYSEEILSMLYSMAITRLVNGFVEKVHGFDNHANRHALSKEKQSISKLADAVGIPRILVDIRHESSHSDLPSLSLLRLAISKALDWLKSNYWEPQKRAIPDVRKEVKCRLRQLVYLLKNKHSKRTKSLSQKGIRIRQTGPLTACSRLSSQITGKLLSSTYDGPQKQISRISKVIARLYSVCPAEVISSLLEFYMSHIPELSSNNGVQGAEVPNNTNLETLGGSENDLKLIIIKLSRKRPGLLLRLLKEVLGMIEAKETMESTKGELFPKLLDSTSVQQITHLSSLVPWLLVGLRDLKESGLIEMTDETLLSSVSVNIVPRVSLTELLRRCLLLSSSGNRHLSASALFLSEMTTNKSLPEKLKRLLLHSSSDKCFTAECYNSYREDNLLLDKQALNRAKLEFDALRSCLKKSAPKHINMQNEDQKAKKMWTLAKTWNPCPIGMLPCSFSSASYLPMLDKGSNLHQEEFKADNRESGNSLRKREADHQSTSLENPNAPKKQREMPEDIIRDAGDSHVSSPMKGMLLIDGVWRKVGEEELQEIEDNIRIIVN